MPDNTAVSATPPPVARRPSAYERPGCAAVHGRPELLQRDLAQELVDVGQRPPTPGADRTSGPAPF